MTDIWNANPKEFKDINDRKANLHERSATLEFMLLICGVPLTVFLSLCINGGIIIMIPYWYYTIIIPLIEEKKKQEIIKDIHKIIKYGNYRVIGCLYSLDKEHYYEVHSMCLGKDVDKNKLNYLLDAYEGRMNKKNVLGALLKRNKV